MKIAIATTINGQREEFAVTPHQTLLEFLRDDLKLKALKVAVLAYAAPARC